MSSKPARVLAVVPARAGSVGIPGKNLRQVGGISLLGRACQLAASTPCITTTVISSDDEAYLQEGLRHGADIAIERPADLATGESHASAAWRHAWIETERRLNRLFDISVWLQPTSPTRTIKDVEAVIAKLKSTGASACLTVSPVPKHFSPHKLLDIKADGTVTPVIPGATPNVRRQGVSETYWLNGHCYGLRRESFLRDGVVIPEGAVPVIIRRPVVNIDEIEDLEEAERILTKSRRAG